MSSGDAGIFLPGKMIYWPRLDAFGKIMGRSIKRHYQPKATGSDVGDVLAFADTLTVRTSWPIHFYGRLMQAVSALQCAWRKWRKDCI